MRKSRIFVVLACLALLPSCSFLDFDETNNLNTREDEYKYFSRAKNMLINVYSYIPDNLAMAGTGLRDCGTDDAEFGNTGSSIQMFNNGNWSAMNTLDTAWELYYGIRAANEFLVSIKDVDLSRYEHTGGYESNVRNLEVFPYEARLLRAYYFFELARRYGDIAMPLEMLTIEEANSIGKTPFAEVIEFIVSECDECALKLPVDYNDTRIFGGEVGRVTKGFAMAVKSKALLYAASELHNPSGDKESWKRSAQAALDLISFAPEAGYELDPNDKWDNSVNTSITTSPEVVLMRMGGDNNNFELQNFPIRFTEGQRNTIGGTYPTQNLVDAFQTADGYPVTLGAGGWECEDPSFDPQNPYEGRDPRFYRTILADGSSFKGSVIETRVGGQDHLLLTEGGTPTGYYLRKYIQEGTSFDPQNPVTNKHHWIIYRYAETLLAYAESMIEAFGDPSYTDAVFTMSAANALNQVRNNAGMPAVTVTGKDEFIAAVRNEWRVEFAFEDHRFWDVRRWKAGYDTQRAAYGVTITETDGIKTYQRALYESRTWSDRMYLYPIPQSELFKNTNLNPQNTGW